MTLTDLYNYADANDIYVSDRATRQVVSMSVPDFIGIDTSKISYLADEKAILAHEIGHCITGSFYNVYSAFDIKGKHEHRANVWAYQSLLPYDALMDAVKDGCTEVWQIAEFFELPEDFTAKAIAFYKERHIA